MTEAINQLQNIVTEYTGRLQSIPEDAFSLKPLPAKWSKKEILGHLVDSAQSNIRRFVVAQYEDKPHIVYSQDAWVAAQAYHDYNSNDLITLWALLNKHICIILKNMPPAAYSRLCNTGKEQEKLYTLQFLADDYVSHHLHHLNQIFNN
jgi:hypothetical protein